MKTFAAVLFISVLLLLFVSCQKEVDDSPYVRPVHVSEGVILEAYVELDTTEPVGVDTISIKRYFYDNLGRVSKITEKWFQKGTTNVTSLTEEVRNYSGIDSFPNLTTRKTILDNGSILSDSIFLSYYSDYVVRKDSVRKYVNSVLQSYSSFSYDKLDNITYYISGSAYEAGNPVPTNQVLVRNTFVNGNLNPKYDSVYGQPSPSFYQVTKLNCQYDNNNNPYWKIALRYPDIGEGFGGYTKNNLTSYSRTIYNSSNTNPQTENTAISYTYNSSGWPITIEFSNSFQPFQTYLFYRN